MSEGKFNQFTVEKINFKTYVKGSFGLSKFMWAFLQQRVEWYKNIDLTKENINWFIFNIYFKKLFQKKRAINKLRILNILILDFLWTYRGWRHMKGLPVRGQRTWSNGWSSFRSNSTLRNIKIKWAQKYYSGVSIRDIKVGIYAEYNNLLWKNQWYKNWEFARDRRARIKIRGRAKIDIVSMAAGHIFLPSLKRELTKKQKALQEKSIYAVGYQSGFSKNIFNEFTKLKVIRNTGDKRKTSFESKTARKKLARAQTT